VRDEIGVAVTTFVQDLEPVGVTVGVPGSERVLARERRIPQDGVEPRVLAVEDLGELELPVERHEWPLGMAEFLEPTAVGVGVPALEGALEGGALRLALLRLGAREERRDHQVTGKLDPMQLPVCFPEQLIQLGLRHVIGGVPDPVAQLVRALVVLAHLQGDERPALAQLLDIPVKALDLLGREPHERVAMLECVVHERERMLARECGEPERHLGKVDGHGVAVHAVQAALRDHAPGEDDLVLVGGDLRLCVVELPGLDERVGEASARLDEERARAHRRVTDLQVEDLLGPRRLALRSFETLEDGAERRAHDGLGKRTRCVVRARAATLLARL